jgi:hypothetical protein
MANLDIQPLGRLNFQWSQFDWYDKKSAICYAWKKRSHMAIAQMNWGRMLFSLDHPRMAEFSESLDGIYGLADRHQGFIWRIRDVDAATQLQALGFDNMLSATVSVWETEDALREYTFRSLHGQFIDQKREWFEAVEGPQLVIWNVDQDAQPTFGEAFERLEILKVNGPSSAAYSWSH